MNGFDVDFYCPSIMSQVYSRIPFVYDDQERVNSKLKQSIFPENRHRLFHIHSQIMLVVWLVKVRDYFRCTFSDYHYNRQQISNYNNHLCSRVSRCCVYLSHVDLLIYKLVELCTLCKNLSHDAANIHNKTRITRHTFLVEIHIQKFL